MLEKIPVLDSQVIRALIVAGVGVVGVICSFFGVDEALFSSEKVQKLADGVATLATLVGIVWAGWARTTRPSPPLSERAVEATKVAVEKGDLTSVPATPSKQSQGGFLRLHLAGVLAAVAVSLAVGGVVAGCSGTKAAYSAAHTRAETVLPDTAYVVAEQYRAILHEAVTLKESGRLPPEVVAKLQQADAAVKPLVLGDPQAVPPRPGLQQLSETFAAVRSASSEAELQRAVDAAVLALADFIKAVDDARRFQ